MYIMTIVRIMIPVFLFNAFLLFILTLFQGYCYLEFKKTSLFFRRLYLFI